MAKKKLSLDKREILKAKRQEIEEKKLHFQVEPQEGVIEIKFRMPTTGESKMRKFKTDHKIFTMFDYVDCFCREEFE
jgi:hypothetical protein